MSYNNQNFRSKIEAFFARKLDEAGISWEYESQTYTVFQGFQFRTEKVRPITYTPDFQGEGWIVELKGWSNDSWPLRLKLWKKYMEDNNMPQEYFVLRTQQDCLKFIKAIKEED